MQKLNILVLGPKSFLTTLNELETFLKFNITTDEIDFSNVSNNKFNAIICHKEYIIDNEREQLIDNLNCIKLLATNEIKNKKNFFDGIISLPTSINEINTTVELTIAKKEFNKSSSILIKDYLLDKNEKKLIKKANFIILTEKEIKLLELLLEKKKPISKNEILSLVWNYSSDADTHTVETHIYRLRKKITNKFLDEKFILNNKKGYYLWKKEIKLHSTCLLRNIAREWLNQKKERVVLKEGKNSLI